MKAAVLFERGGIPQFVENFPEPVTSNKDEIVMTVRAAAIKHLDRSRASGKHYSAKQDLSQAKIPGGDGVGLLPDGTRVYALGVTGMLAEKAIVERARMIPLPDDLDDITAAAIPNAVAGSAMALLFRGRLVKDETVLINGATGFTGKMAVQLAKYYGAKNIIVTGRDPDSLEALRPLGATVLILNTNDEKFGSTLRAIHAQYPIDVVIDYLWGRPAEFILNALKRTGSFTHKTRFVSVGAMAGENIQLPAEILRSVDLQLSGSGLGSWTREEMKHLFSVIVPEAFQLAAKGKLIVDTNNIRLEEVTNLWNGEMDGGRRMVVVM